MESIDVARWGVLVGLSTDEFDAECSLNSSELLPEILLSCGQGNNSRIVTPLELF